ncbi:DUF3173 domain-containing protein [Listeria booriae]|nr:DUF3173 domain-containing protein [Listeria booriae]
MLTKIEKVLLMHSTVSKDDLIELGFRPYQAKPIIREAKHYMVAQGYPYYNNKRLGCVPSYAVDNIVGLLPEKGVKEHA